MNGRIYDYNIGRFLSVDPFIQGTGSQGINPYSYVLNNPLSFTDPTGYSAEEDVETKTVIVTRTGSRLREKIEVSATSNNNGSATVSISGGSGSARQAVGNAVKSGAKSLGYSAVDIGSPQNKAKTSPSGGGKTSESKNTDKGPTVDIDWQSYLNDETARQPINASMQDMFNMDAGERPWNYSIEFENWIAANQFIDSTATEKLGIAIALAGRGGRSLFPHSLKDGIGLYKYVGGHHIHAKAGFKQHATYNLRNGLSISNSMMKKLNLDHSAMTAYQRRAFKDLYKSGAQNSLKAHTAIAVGALKAGGANDTLARRLAAQSLLNLRSQGVRFPSNIPWYK